MDTYSVPEIVLGIGGTGMNSLVSPCFLIVYLLEKKTSEKIIRWYVQREKWNDMLTFWVFKQELHEKVWALKLQVECQEKSSHTKAWLWQMKQLEGL